MLQGAAAAGAEMRAWWADAVGGGLFNRSVGGPGLAAAGERAWLDEFPGEGVCEEEGFAVRKGGDPVTIGADRADGDVAGLRHRRRRGRFGRGRG